MGPVTSGEMHLLAEWDGWDREIDDFTHSCKVFTQDKLLGASFFFKRGEADRGNAMKLFPTIVKQLAAGIPQLAFSIGKAINDDPDVAVKSLTEQFHKLLLQPLLGLKQGTSQIPSVVVIVDALDECENDKDIRLILDLLPQLRKPNAVNVRVFLTSRPELPIRLGFSEIKNDDYQDLALHEITETVTEHDISLFLKYRFARIRTARNSPIDWPGDDSIQTLLTMTVPLFISAATVCRFVEDPKWEPTVRLAELLKNQAKYATKMDKTYLPILTRLLDDQDEDESEQLLQQFQRIVGVIILLAVPLSVNALSRFLGMPAVITSNHLDSFQSVLSIPNDLDLPVRILHLSFRDFLVQSRSKFRVDEQQTHNNITIRCLTIMRRCLKMNICNLENHGTQRIEIKNELIHQHLTPELQYSCRYWAHHLVLSKNLDAVMQNAYLLLQKHFLHWMEAMSILGLVSEAVTIIGLLQTVTHDDDESVISTFLHDAKRFVLQNRRIAEDMPLQFYCSGLLFAPRRAIIRKQFEAELPSWISMLPKVEETWSALQQTLEGHSAPVSSVAFSPDGKLLASGSDDNTIRLWDPATGALRQVLEGHSAPVSSVAFSPDGQLLASGSDDNTIRLWDPAKGTIQQILEGHSSWVSSVAFSHDGQLLASSSRDNTIKLWYPTTGVLQWTLQGHSSWVSSIGFSRDSRLLASGSFDKTVRLWDPLTGALQYTLKAHSHSVRTVAFSHNGQLLASGSYDNTVRLWDPITGALQWTLQGHLDSVGSVAFSRDDQVIASGSYDNTVRLWDPATGALKRALKAHSASVQSVEFSHDDRLLASGSSDDTVRLWDTSIGIVHQALEGHSSLVQSMAFSDDGRLLASGASDKTVRLWDTSTGVVHRTLEGHSRGIYSVAFSHDGQLLASGSNDNLVKLWDPATGALQQTLKGHSSWISSVVFSRDDRLLASGSRDKTVRLWNPFTGALQQILEGHSGSVGSVAFSRDSRLLASGSRDNTVRLWDPATGALQQTLEGHSHWIWSVAFSHDGRLLASGSHDKTVRIWEPTTGALQKIIYVQGVATNLNFSKDDSHLYTNLGCLKLQFSCDTHTDFPRVNANISILDREWVAIRGEKVLWLPRDYRPSCSVIKGNTICLGHASGRVSFIVFRA